MLAMSVPSIPSVSVLLLVLFLPFSESVCPECLAFDGHLESCHLLNQPITGTDTAGLQVTTSIHSSDWLPNSSLLGQEVGCVNPTPALSVSQSAPSCKFCGRRFKNNRGLKIHIGHAHKGLSDNDDNLTLVHTQHQCQQVATVTGQSATFDMTTVLTSTSSSMTASPLVTAATLSTSPVTNALEHNECVTTATVGSVLRRSKRVSALHDTVTGGQTTATIDKSMVCICGRRLINYRGLRSHQRGCLVSRRLLGDRTTAAEESQTLTCSQSAVNMTESKLNNDPSHFKINHDLTDNMSFNHSSSNLHLISNNTNSYCPTITDTTVTDNTNPVVAEISPPHLIESDLIRARGVLPRLLPLPGVSLPKSDEGWREMNHFLHAAPIFRFATGVISNIDMAASEFNQAIYSYLRDRYGTLGTPVKNDLQSYAVYETKYQGWSTSKIRRMLFKLKHKGPAVQGSPLCDEILFLSHRLRSGIKSKAQANKPVTDRDFREGFWPSCRKLFTDVVGASPAFTISECGEYFSKVLSIPGSLSSCLFKIPNWFVSLPNPETPFNQAPPSYAEIASIIKKARASASACPLDQISVITLKKCPILRTILHNLIVNCWQSQYTPKAWRVGITILIYKKGDPSKVDNFRPITLQSVPYKIFSSFIRNRLQAFLDSNNYHNNNIQKGFAHGQDGVLEHTELLDFMMRDAKKSHRGYFAVLLDLRNAFGEIHHNLIRSSLKYHHVPDTFIRIFDSIYHDFGVAVSSCGQLTDMISVRRGVLQGDPCSPLLFNLCFNSLMRLLETPGYRQMGYLWGSRQHQQCSWLQYADDALIIANSLSTAQGLVRLFESWCDWAKMDIRLDKCLSFGAVMLDRKFQQILPKINLKDKGMIPAVPLGGHFKYLGKIFDFKALNSVPMKDFETKLEKILIKITSLKIRSQTKLKIFSMYVPSQFNFELKIYKFTDAFLSGTVDRLCTKHIREWLEFPPSSCVLEWVSSPTNFCGLGIPSFAQRAARMGLIRRHLLYSSKNPNIRELWEVSKAPNVVVDSLLDDRDINQASTILTDSQSKDSIDYFLGLKKPRE